MPFDPRDHGPIGKTARCQGQARSGPGQTATVHRHPKMMRGLQLRLSRVRTRLVADDRNGLLALEEIVASLHAQGWEPFPGYTENMTAEFAAMRGDLARLDPAQPKNAQRFMDIARRIKFLSHVVSFVADNRPADPGNDPP